ncbi:hypothetical protein JT358_16055 [Micrococcales bacterium 31B]|nr:hypothetical protein [Micrococcales bacterium 31B]
MAATAPASGETTEGFTAPTPISINELSPEQLKAKAALEGLTFVGLDTEAPRVSNAELLDPVTQFAAAAIDSGTGQHLKINDSIISQGYDFNIDGTAIPQSPSKAAAPVNVHPAEVQAALLEVGEGGWVAIVVPDPEGTVPVLRLLHVSKDIRPASVPVVDAQEMPSVAEVNAGGDIAPQGDVERATRSSAVIERGSGAPLAIGDHVDYHVTAWDWSTGRTVEFPENLASVSQPLGSMSIPCIDDALVGHTKGSVVEVVCDVPSMNVDAAQGASTAVDAAMVAKVVIEK